MSLLDKASLIVTPNGYSENTIYSVIPSSGAGDLSFTRATDAWRVNSQGLVQRTPWNLFQYSQEFDNAAWTKSNVTITANTTISPSGVQNADTMSLTGTTSRVIAPNTLSAGTYTISVWIRILSGSGTMRFNLTIDGVNTNVIFSPTNQWQRFTTTFTVVTSATPIAFRAPTFVGDVAIWGAQLVEGSSALEYFPTTDRQDVPRIDYSLGGCPNILLEPQRTNIALQSSNFNDVSWLKLGTTTPIVTANTAISPSGIMDADRLQFASIASAAIVYQSLSHTSGQQITVSVYAKRNAATDQVFRLFGDAGVSISSIFTATSEWQRFTYTYTATATGGRTMGLYNVLNVASDIQIWGFQFEVGSYPTSYIPTTTASVTRNVDTFIRNNIYTNGLVTAAGGTWFIELNNNVPYVREASGSAIWLGDTSSGGTNAFVLRNDTTSARRLRISKNVSAVQSPLFLTTTDTIKVAIKWNGTTADVFVNGVKVDSATSFPITNMQFLGGSGAHVPTFIKQMSLYPTPLSDSELELLTGDYFDTYAAMAAFYNYTLQ